MIDFGGLETSIASSALRALVASAIRPSRRLVTGLRRKMRERDRQAHARAVEEERTGLVDAATRANERVLARVIPTRGGPTKALWDGACPDETFYFNGDHAMYVRYMRERRVPPLRALPGRPPRVGTREPCRC